jgi:hypothetical protein
MGEEATMVRTHSWKGRAIFSGRINGTTRKSPQTIIFFPYRENRSLLDFAVWRKNSISPVSYPISIHVGKAYPGLRVPGGTQGVPPGYPFEIIRELNQDLSRL